MQQHIIVEAQHPLVLLACRLHIRRLAEQGCFMPVFAVIRQSRPYANKGRTLIPVCRLQIFCELLVAGLLIKMRDALQCPFNCLSRSLIAATAGSS